MDVFPQRRSTHIVLSTSFTIAVIVALAPASGARASNTERPTVRTLATFADPDEHPESVALGRDGTAHVALHAAAGLWHRSRGGRITITTLPRSTLPGAVTRANGIAVAPTGVVSVAMLSNDPTVAGVWEGRPGGQFRRVSTLPETASPNGMSRDANGTLYIADDLLGVVWRVPARRSATPTPAEEWLRHPLLERIPGGTPYGANGTEIHRGELWISNPSRTLLAAAPLDRPGAITARRSGPIYADVDDFDIEHDGTIVAARISTQSVERIHSDGSSTVLATAADGLSQPTAVAVDESSCAVYVTNAAFHRPAGSPPASVQLFTHRPKR